MNSYSEENWTVFEDDLIMQVKKLLIIDPTYLKNYAGRSICGYLGSQSVHLGRDSFTQWIPDFINPVQNCLHFFGRVLACIVPVNLKSAVTKSRKYKPFINEQFAGFASHNDTSLHLVPYHNTLVRKK